MKNEKDICRLNLLGTCHNALGGIAVIASCLMIIGLIAATIHQPWDSDTNGLVGIAIVVAVVDALRVGVLAIFLLILGRILRRRKGRILGIVMTGIECVISFYMVAISTFLTMSVGFFTVPLLIFFILLFVLSVSTLITLNKKSVKELYRNKSEETI